MHNTGADIFTKNKFPPLRSVRQEAGIYKLIFSPKKNYSKFKLKVNPLYAAFSLDFLSVTVTVSPIMFGKLKTHPLRMGFFPDSELLLLSLSY